MKIAIPSVSVLAAMIGLGSVVVLSVVVAQEPTAPIVIPDTSVSVWRAIDEKVADLEKDIQSSHLKELHQLAYAIKDLVAGLSTRSTELSADKRRHVIDTSRYVPRLAEQVGAAGDANDKSAARYSFEKLKNVLTAIHSNYSGH